MANEQLNHSEGTGSAYRVYVIGANGKITNAISVMAENDDDAIRQARQTGHNGPVELWDRSRLMFRHAENKQSMRSL